MIKTVLLVGLGGGAGCMLRYLTSVAVNRYVQSSFPFATFAVNIIGCLIMGLVVGFMQKQQANDSAYYLFVTGFCGGYTTFSAFAGENLSLLQSGNVLTAFAYIASSIVAGLFAVWLGMVLVR